MSGYRYRTLKEKVRVRFTVKGSRFIGTASPVKDEAGSLKFIGQVRAEFPDATHHAYAYRIGSGATLVERAHDAREPAGTAGLPMLQLLQGEELSSLAVVGTRYFGGTKLGIGGLTRAYRQCARGCIEEGELVERERLSRCRLTVTYEEVGALMRQLEMLQAEITATDYGAAVTVTAALPSRHVETMKKRLKEITRGEGLWEALEEPPAP